MYLQLIQDGKIEREVAFEDRMVVGRRQPDESPGDDVGRFLVAEPHVTTVPRKWFEVQTGGQKAVKLRNIHGAHQVFVEDVSGPLEPGEVREFSLARPVVIRIGNGCLCRVTLQSQAESEARRQEPPLGIRSLDLSVAAAEHGDDGSQVAMQTLMAVGKIESETALRLLKKALKVVEAAASSDGFLEAAAQAAAEIVGLDRVVILVPESGGIALTRSATVQPFDSKEGNRPTDSEGLLDRETEERNPLNSETNPKDLAARERVRDGVDLGATRWLPRAEYAQPKARELRGPKVSRAVVKRVVDLRQTQIFEANLDSMSMSLESVSGVIAAPILDRNRNVIGVLYGDRWLATGTGGSKVSQFEALLIDVLANSVAGGIARQQEERSKANLSEFFSPRVASMLVNRPELLVGRDAEVSVLFCDVRGFSAISEQYGAERTIAWINEVLTELSQCVVDADGVLVDYVGDELLAMWGAPEPQADHAERALRTARDMLRTIDRLREHWRGQIGENLDVGIGVNSGPARVGNVGSRLKFKYGVLGNTVNMGSRLQGACKYFGVRCVGSETTMQAAQAEESSRKLATIQVVGINEPIRVVEYVSDPGQAWQGLKQGYEQALDAFEREEYGEALQGLGKLVQDYPNDRPSAVLLGRAARALTEGTGDCETVWRLDGK